MGVLKSDTSGVGALERGKEGPHNAVKTIIKSLIEGNRSLDFLLFSKLTIAEESDNWDK
jgi:hypothetical protein